MAKPSGMKHPPSHSEPPRALLPISHLFPLLKKPGYQKPSIRGRSDGDGEQNVKSHFPWTWKGKSSWNETSDWQQKLMKKDTNGWDKMVISESSWDLQCWGGVLWIAAQVRLNCTLSGSFPLKFPASLGCTECSLNHLGFFFFTKEIGDAHVWVPKPERLWLPQIKQGVSGQSPQGLWGPTSPSALHAASPTSTPSPPWPFPLSLHSPIRREGCPQGVLISLTHGSQLYWA